MYRFVQIRLFRFLHGADVFDAWPGDDMSPLRITSSRLQGLPLAEAVGGRS